MSGQLLDTVMIEGTRWPTLDLPMEQYFATLPERLGFAVPHPANYRGYYAEWLILRDRLYLTRFSGLLEEPEERQIGKDYFFGKDRPLVLATWFSGDLRVRRDGQIAVFEIENGIIKRRPDGQRRLKSP